MSVFPRAWNRCSVWLCLVSDDSSNGVLKNTCSASPWETPCLSFLVELPPSQTSDTIPSDLLSLVPQQRMYAPHPIGLAPRLVSRPDVNTQALVVLGPLAGPALEPGQIAAARDFQCPTGHGQRVPLAVNPVLQEHVPCKDSFAKYAAAFFTISRSISARASSRRSRTTSA